MKELMGVESNSSAWIIPTKDPNFITLRIATPISISYLEDIGFLIHEGVFMPEAQVSSPIEGGKLFIIPTEQDDVVELISEVTVPSGQISQFAQFPAPRSTFH